jgi:hypothetical protein
VSAADILLVTVTLVGCALAVRPFRPGIRAAYVAVVSIRLLIMFAWHQSIVEKTGVPIVIDANADEIAYYELTTRFANYPPFDVSLADCLDAVGGNMMNIGYSYVLAILQTVAPDPISAVEFFKEFLLLTGLGLLARGWRKSCGEWLAALGLFLLVIIFVPGFYYNFRNLKDGLLLGLFVLAMAGTDELMRRRDATVLRSSGSLALGAAVLLLIVAIAFVRIYTAVFILGGILLQLLFTAKLPTSFRVAGVVFVAGAVLAGANVGLVDVAMDASESMTVNRDVPLYLGLLQGFLSPQPWNPELPWYLATFYWVYLVTLPYTFYALFSSLRRNLRWGLFVYAMVTYVVSGPIGDPPRKRLIAHPIMVSWVLNHLAAKNEKRRLRGAA